MGRHGCSQCTPRGPRPDVSALWAFVQGQPGLLSPESAVGGAAGDQQPLGALCSCRLSSEGGSAAPGPGSGFPQRRTRAS